ncbi:MAG: FecR domain-containing protein [Acidobacteria bacterium]|nr:FecR domain-containing protein [Acidobacteriota bacterium]
MVRRSLFITAAAFFVMVGQATAARAQASTATANVFAPAHISVVEGSATLERDGRTDEAPGNMPLLAGDRLRTRAGRVEILFADGGTLHLDHNTTIDLQSDELVRLIDGRVRLSIPGPARAVAYRIDAPHAWLQIAEPGEYRAALVQGMEFEAAVLRGRAELINEDGRTPLRAGERAFARANAAPSYAYVFNSAAWDGFDRWSEARRADRLGLSAQYLADEVRPYAGTLDRHGSWRYESSYGYVWYPRVDDGWRPYYQGRWATLPSYGWTWIGTDAWAWPTHHYGRWGVSSGTWFWIPGRTWGPAWVSWASAPGYVSWCPLGWNNRPVVQIVNINGHRGYDPWRAWTVVPQRHFGGDYVHRRVVSGTYLNASSRNAFSHRDSAPRVVGYAVPRASVPIRLAGTDSVRRGSTPLLSNRGEGAARQHASEPVRADREGVRSRTAAGEVQADRSSARQLDRTAGAQLDRSPGGARDRMTPDRPLVRSRRDAPSPSDRSPRTEPRDPARVGTSRELLPSHREENEAYRARDAYRAGPTYDPVERRAAPRGGYARPADAAPSEPRGGQRAPDLAAPPREHRGAPAERPAPSSAQPSRPERAGPPPSTAPPSAAPPSSARPANSRPRGGDAPHRGQAVRRPGGIR